MMKVQTPVKTNETGRGPCLDRVGRARWAGDCRVLLDVLGALRLRIHRPGRRAGASLLKPFESLPTRRSALTTGGMRSRRGFAAFAFGLLLVGTGFADEPKILDPQQAEAERRKLSERILENTQAARDQLAKSVTDATTQELQEGIVEDLTRLIELLRNSPPPPRGGSSSSQSDSDSSSQQDQESSRSKEESARRPPPGRAGTGKDRPKAEDSEERHGESKEGQALAERRRRLQSDIWGHLPPALREQLLNTYGERMLPQYEDFVRRFYEVLSEPKRPARR